MTYIGETKKRCVILQLSGGALSIFLLFIRYSDFSRVSTSEAFTGKWPIGLNAVFNALATYLFLISIICVFLPVFLGKLSIIRDIYASPFFRPLSRMNFSASIIEGLFILVVFFS
jgi:hypothetical protein